MNLLQVRLGDVCDIQSGGTPSRNNPDYWGPGVPWAKISDIEAASNRMVTLTEEQITTEGLSAIRNRIFKRGTLLFAIYGSVGKMAFADCELSTNQAILGISPKTNTVNMRWLFHFLSSRAEQFQIDANGVTQKNLSAGYLRDLKLDLPSISEQDRIADILDRAGAIKESRNIANTLCEDLVQSVFLEFFGDLEKNPKLWPVETLGRLIEKIETGKSLAPVPDNTGLGLRVLKVSAITSGIFKPSESKPLDLAYEPPSTTHFVKEGDFLFSRANTAELVGAVVCVESVPKNILLPDKIWRLCWDEEKIVKPFALMVMKSHWFRGKLIRTATGTSGSMKNISQDKLLAQEIPVPSMETQLRFAKVFSEMGLLRARVTKADLLSKDLSRCLLEKYFSYEALIK